jgi:hypothetical protein
MATAHLAEPRERSMREPAGAHDKGHRITLRDDTQRLSQPPIVATVLQLLAPAQELLDSAVLRSKMCIVHIGEHFVGSCTTATRLLTS